MTSPIRDTKNFFSGTDVENGTYTFKGDSVFLEIENSSISGKATGSVLTTNMGTISGKKRIYTKQ
ncbi:MAG: hypothetical protein LBH84_01175 [Prevotellaceae bacterium]|jgi:hypothetical protein|nr:hypothetical protein [Prevotellaceae bacterium]